MSAAPTLSSSSSSSSSSLSWSSSTALLCETRWHGRLLAVQRPALNTTVTIAGRSVRAVAGGALVDGVAHVVDQPVVLGSGPLSLVLTRALREPSAPHEREFDLVWLQTMMTVVILAIGGLAALWLTPTLPRFDDDLRPGQHLLSHVTVLPPQPPPPQAPVRVAAAKPAASVPAAAAPRAKATTKQRREQDRAAAMDALRELGLTGPAVATASVFGAGSDIDAALSNLNGTGTAGVGVSGLGTRGGGGDGTGKNVGVGVLGSGKPGGRGDDSLLSTRNGHRGVDVPSNKIIYIGGLGREDIQRVMSRAMSRIRYCYERALTSSPDLEGKLTVLFQIGGTGDVASVSKVQSTLTNDVDTCVQRVLQSLKFPTPKGGGVVNVTYPFVFTAH